MGIKVSKKALITGGAGFIGSHLVERLIGIGWNVTVLDKSDFADYKGMNEISNHSEVNFQKIDITESDQIKELDNDYDYIFHLAAELGVANVLSAPYQILDSNIVSTRNMIKFAETNSRLNRFIFASTSEVYDGTLKCFNAEIPTTEQEPLTIENVSSPRSTYMLSKIVGESYCHFADIPFTILRIFNTYGPRGGTRHVIPELLERMHFVETGKSIDVFSPNHTRSFCYVEDAVNQIFEIMSNSSCENQTINLGNQTREIKIYDLAKICMQTVGKDIQLNKIGETEGSAERRTPSMKKSMELTGYHPKISLEDGIAMTYSWYLDNVFKA